ncbi:DUF1120 domain-containing protein [Herbaspirillum robiniae]|uniref:DUF1120 domain-containing protein n=1 Tax=Herbaspirillum robiniae TaxID=2014887 RepID=UPI003D77EA27
MRTPQRRPIVAAGPDISTARRQDPASNPSSINIPESHMYSWQPVVVFLFALVSTAALASPPTELKVAGTIRPGACLPSFGHAAHVHFGNISSAAFKNRRRLSLPAQQFRFSITCDVRMRVGVTPHDNQAHSADRGVSDELTDGASASREDIFGLGSDLGRDLGGYEARFVPGSFTADGKEVDTISAPGERSGWIRRHGGQIRHGVTNSWAARGSQAPGEFADISGMLRISPVVNAMGELKQDANLDGSLTLELAYL